MMSYLLLTLGFFISPFSSWCGCKVRLFIWFFSCFLRKACIPMNHPLSTAFTESHTFGLSCLYFHLILCIFWFPFLMLPWSVGYSEAFCLGSFNTVQSFSRVWFFMTPCTAAQQASLSSTNPQSLLKLMSIVPVMPNNHLILCHPLLLLPSIFPSIRVFSMGQFFASGGQSIGVSDSPSVLPINIQDWYPLGWTGWIFLQSKRLSRVFSNTTVQKHWFFRTQFSLYSNSHIHTWLLEKTIAFTRGTSVGKEMALLFNMMSRLFKNFLSRSKHLLVSWLQSLSAVILEPPKIQYVTVSIVSCIYLPWSEGTRYQDLSFLNVEF